MTWVARSDSEFRLPLKPRTTLMIDADDNQPRRVTMLASVARGEVWSSASSDFGVRGVRGVRGVLSRFRQIAVQMLVPAVVDCRSKPC